MPGASKWGSEFLVNTITAGHQEQPAVTALANGRFVVTWLDQSHSADDPSGGAIRAQVFNADGSKLGGEFRANTTVHNHQSEPAIAALADGRFVVAWTDDSQSGGDTSELAVRAQIFNADGTRSGSEFLIPATTESFQSLPTITGLADGRFVAAWTDDSETGGDTDSGAIRARIFNADGTPSSSEFLVNTTTDQHQFEPTITALANGNFVVAWTDLSETGGDLSSYAVRGRVYQADGTPVSSELLINTATNGSQHEPSITGLADGRFVVVWSDFSQASGDSDGYAVRARIFEADGAPSTGEFVVNTTTDGWQLTPKIAALPDGRFIASWVDTSTGENQFRAQVFNTDGSKSGGELVVAAPASTSDDHTITALADGRFVIAWSGNQPTGGDASGHSVRAQIFDPRETAVNLAGTSGNDDFVGTGFGDTLGGGAGNDRLSGGDGIDWLSGGNGDDVLNGGSGNDSMMGGAGNDTYMVDSAGDAVTENAGEGTDTVNASITYSLGAYVENLVLTGSADLQGYGNAQANRLTGNSGANRLDGGAGADMMAGGAGTDVYIVDNSFDQVIEAAGEGQFDTVYASVSYALCANIENLFLQGTGNFQAIGNAQSNTITGNDGDNLMDGGGGIDGLIGGKGNDGYVIDNSFDQIVENVGDGDFDTVYTSVDYQLGANLENVFMQGTANLAVYGNELSNVITGNDGDNLLNGGLGIDGLIGGKGGDTYVIDNSFDQIVEYANEGTDAVYANVSYQLGENLETLFLSGDAIQGYGNSGVNSIVGTAGNNGIDGRGGADVLTGNGGIDTFIFNRGEMNGDTIMDFDGEGAGSGDQLMFVGFGAGASLQQISANVWQVDYNGGASHEQFTLANGASLHASDFVFL